MQEVVLPHKLRNRGRNAYYKMLSAVATEVGLSLDTINHKKVVLLSGDRVVAIIESDAIVGAPDDLTNELTPGGLNKRKYDGLEIFMVVKEYEETLKGLVLILKAILKEDVFLRFVVYVDEDQDAIRLLEEVQLD